MLLLMLGLVAAFGSNAEEGNKEVASVPGTLEFVGHNLFGDANGKFHAWRITESSVDPAALADSYAVVEVDLASVDTGIVRRDDHLRDPDFFEVEKFPVARIRVHSLMASGDPELGQPRFAASFDIDLHGVQKTVEGEIRRVSEAPLIFEGGLVLDRVVFGVGAPPSRWNPMSVKAEIPVSFRVEF